MVGSSGCLIWQDFAKSKGLFTLGTAVVHKSAGLIMRAKSVHVSRTSSTYRRQAAIIVWLVGFRAACKAASKHCNHFASVHINKGRSR